MWVNVLMDRKLRLNPEKIESMNLLQSWNLAKIASMLQPHNWRKIMFLIMVG